MRSEDVFVADEQGVVHLDADLDMGPEMAGRSFILRVKGHGRAEVQPEETYEAAVVGWVQQNRPKQWASAMRRVANQRPGEIVRDLDSV